MKTNKKILLALLTASCLAAGALGLTACNNTPSEKPEDKDPPPNVTTPTDKADLNDGLNEVTFTAENAEIGILYTYTAKEAGTYAFAVAGTNASVKVNDTAVTSHVANLEAGEKLELVCASSADEKATYSVYAGKAAALNVGANDNVAIPANKAYAMHTVAIEEVGTYKLTFADNINAEYSLLVNGVNTTATWYNDYAPIVELTAGQNVIVLTSNVPENSVGNNKVSITISEHNEEAKVLALGDNTVQTNFNGVTYTFTAPESANYTFSVDTTNENICVDINDNTLGYVYGEVTGSVTLGLKKGATISVECLTNEVGDAEYNVNITKTSLPSSGEITLDKGATFGVDANNTATVTLKSAEAGSYSLSLFDLTIGDTVTVKINNGEPRTATVQDFAGRNARATITFELDEAVDELEIQIVCANGTTAVTVEIYKY